MNSPHPACFRAQSEPLPAAPAPSPGRRPRHRTTSAATLAALALCSVLTATLSGCRSANGEGEPPDARRPVLKTQAELDAERQELIASGAIAPTTQAVVLDSERRPAAAAVAAAEFPIPPGALQGDLLMVNDTALTAAEVIYGLGDRLDELRRSQTPAGFAQLAEREIRRYTQQEIGTILVYNKAVKTLSEQQTQSLDKAIDEEVEKIIARDYGGSRARLTRHLQDCGLNFDQYRTQVKRQLVVRQYAREVLAPRTTPRRDELIDFYRRYPEQFSSPETREFWLIDIPHERCLPEGLSWSAATPQQRALARLAAVRQIRAASEAIPQRSFEETAREFSRGPHASEGGLVASISKPMQAPYDALSQRIFEMSQGQVTEPIERENGWAIVRCGQITPAKSGSFEENQADIRRAVAEENYNRAMQDYVYKLAEKATITSLDLFVRETVKRAQRGAPARPA